MERMRQDESFVRDLLSKVLHLLYKTLQERASQQPSLAKDLGLPTGSEIPVSVSMWVPKARRIKCSASAYDVSRPNLRSFQDGSP